MPNFVVAGSGDEFMTLPVTPVADDTFTALTFPIGGGFNTYDFTLHVASRLFWALEFVVEDSHTPNAQTDTAPFVFRGPDTPQFHAYCFWRNAENIPQILQLGPPTANLSRPLGTHATTFVERRLLSWRVTPGFTVPYSQDGFILLLSFAMQNPAGEAASSRNKELTYGGPTPTG